MGGIRVNILTTPDQSQMFVYAEGEVLHKGGPMTGKDLYQLLTATHGAIEYLEYTEVSNEAMKKPITALYGPGDWGPDDEG